MREGTKYVFYKSLRFRFGVFFGFLFFIVLMGFIFVLYNKIQHELEQGFNSRLKAGAELVLQKTSVNPLVIPLPLNNESFFLIYNDTRRIDTLYATQIPMSARNISISKSLETGGQLHLKYTLPDDELSASLSSWQRLLFIYLPLAFLFSLLLGYTLSGVLLHPIRQIITKAADTDLQSDIQLLPEPSTTDELHQLTEALNRMLQRIKHQTAEQNAFFASASHELRTPLSVMLTELQVLEVSVLSKEMQAVVHNQKAEVKRLIKLVNNFLLMSQLKAGATIQCNEEIDLLETCINVVSRLGSGAKAQGVRFRLSVVPNNTDFTILADKQQADTILTNILGNAIKYSRCESVIEVKITKEAEGVRLLVSNETDTEIENPAQLGKQFYREVLSKDGFGLGLWIVRRLLERNEATMTIDYSQHRFTVALNFSKQLNR